MAIDAEGNLPDGGWDTLNAVDATKVQVGQRATMTFDAIDGLTLTGKVASVDTVGTVSQGVVNYTVTISFDSTDPRVKPGMSVDASIITDTAQDVLIVPSSAIKTANGTSYVQILPNVTASADSTAPVTSETAPEDVTVTTGLSDDTNTAVTSGLTDGETVVIKTNLPTAAKATTTASATSLLGGGATRGGGAGAYAGGGARTTTTR